jgi:hypothetical protein
MEHLTFNDDWETSVQLIVFAEKLSNISLVPSYSKELRAQKRYILSINESLNGATSAQLNTIQFIEDNQEQILQMLFDYLQNHIYPEVRETWGDHEKDNPDCFPEFEKIEHLKNVIGLDYIEIELSEKEGFAYYKLNFEWVVDIEHGLTVIAHQLRPLAFTAIGDGDNAAIDADLEN